MILEIPTTNYQRFVQRTTLDGIEFSLVFDWNARGGFWTLSIYTSAEDLIVAGLVLVHGWPLLRAVTDPRRPPGQIYCIDTTGAERTPGFDDLGAGCRLYYFDAAETFKPGPQ